MPDTAEHRAEMHQLATQRKAAGQPVWDRKIRLGDVFHNDALTFEQRRDAIVKRLHGWVDASDRYLLAGLVDELSDTRDTDKFDQVWDAIYDEADYDRVWIDTHGIAR